MTEAPNLWLKLSNAPESLLLVHQALSAIAGALGLDALETDDLRTAAAEACKNVVYHAYEGGEGPLEVELHTLEAAIEVVVRDHGIGIRPHLGERTLPHNGIGMPIVHALCQRVLYSNLDGGGTEVRMRLAMPNVVELAPAGQTPGPPETAGGDAEGEGRGERGRSGEAGAGGEGEGRGERDRGGEAGGGEGELLSTVAMTLAPSALADAVLAPVLRALAARAGLSAAGADEGGRRARTLAASFGESGASGPLQIALEVAADGLDLRIGQRGELRELHLPVR
jgi:anti-sigma regulatory factor (Ser/Thr protein kinase)